MYAIYPRKSKKKEDSESMQMQIDKCTEYILKKDANAVIKVYDGDYGITGHSTKKRFDFQRMMQDVKNGIIDCVVIYKYDRIARNMYDFVVLYHELEENKCNLISVTQDIDTTTPMGKQMMYQYASWAEVEWSMISQRYKDTFAHMNKIGVTHRNKRCMPLGYMRDSETGRMVKDPSESEMVQTVIDDYLLHETIQHALLALNERYNKKYTLPVVKTILFGDFCRGKYKDNVNYCEPYIDAETAKRIDEIHGTYIRNYGKTDRFYLFTGLLHCPECDAVMTCKRQENKKKPVSIWYKCPNHAMHKWCSFTKQIREEVIEQSLIDLIEKRNAEIEVEPQKRKIISTDKLKAERERLTNAYIKGRIEESDYDIAYNELNAKIDAIERQNKQSDKYSKGLFVDGWLEMYKELDSEKKRAFWRGCLSAIHVDNVGNIVEAIFR